jgi:hypothetical protein
MKESEAWQGFLPKGQLYTGSLSQPDFYPHLVAIASDELPIAANQGTLRGIHTRYP